MDQRYSTSIDCSRTIFIFATDVGDSIIVPFWHSHMEGKPEPQQLKAPFSSLDQQMRAEFKAKFGVGLPADLELLQIC